MKNENKLKYIDLSGTKGSAIHFHHKKVIETSMTRNNTISNEGKHVYFILS